MFLFILFDVKLHCNRKDFSLLTIGRLEVSSFSFSRCLDWCWIGYAEIYLIGYIFIYLIRTIYIWYVHDVCSALYCNVYVINLTSIWFYFVEVFVSKTCEALRTETHRLFIFRRSSFYCFRTNELCYFFGTNSVNFNFSFIFAFVLSLNKLKCWCRLFHTIYYFTNDYVA